MERTSQYMSLGHYSQNSVRNYLRELRYFFMYYSDVPIPQLCADHIIEYLLYLNKTLGCSRSKCHGAAQSISFFFRRVLQKPFILPTLIYPRKATKLAPVMSPEEIKALIDTIENVKHRTVVMLLYSTGMRISEVSNLKIADIDSKAMQIKVVQGKGSKDRFTLLSQQVLLELRAYYLICRPKEYLFNGAKEGKPLGVGVISVLHTWGQQLSFHPHLHCIVSGGGITGKGKWKQATKNDWRFLFPVKAMSVVYRGKFMQGLKALIAEGLVTPAEGVDVKALINLVYSKDWVVYAKAPFGGPQAVIEYVGRYTHKVAISNHRIMGISEEEDSVSFQYKDYSDKGRQKQMRLAASEFVRRFSQHILPKGFTKIRMYGYLSNRGRHKRISEVLSLLALPQHVAPVSVPFAVRLLERYGMEVNRCPCCGANTLELVLVYLPWKKGDDG